MFRKRIHAYNAFTILPLYHITNSTKQFIIEEKIIPLLRTEPLRNTRAIFRSKYLIHEHSTPSNYAGYFQATTKDFERKEK